MISSKITASKTLTVPSLAVTSDSSKKTVAVARETLPILIPTASNSTTTYDSLPSYKSTSSDAGKYTGPKYYFGESKSHTEAGFKDLLGWEEKISATMASSFKSDLSGITVESIELPGSSVGSASELGSGEWEFVADPKLT